MVMLGMISANESHMNERRIMCILGTTHYEVIMADFSENGLT